MRVLRVTATLILATTLGAVPLVADWCAVRCDTAFAHGMPACHHAHQSTARIEQPPSPCGHDHRPIVAEAVRTALPPPQALSATAATAVQPSGPLVVAIGTETDPQVPQPSPPLSLTLGSALRI